jgi:hypothetical protein
VFINNLNDLLGPAYSPICRHRIILRYGGIDAFVVRRVHSDEKISVIALADPISPNAAQALLKDLRNKTVDHKVIEFILLDSVGNVINKQALFGL